MAWSHSHTRLIRIGLSCTPRTSFPNGSTLNNLSWAVSEVTPPMPSPLPALDLIPLEEDPEAMGNPLARAQEFHPPLSSTQELQAPLESLESLPHLSFDLLRPDNPFDPFLGTADPFNPEPSSDFLADVGNLSIRDLHHTI